MYTVALSHTKGGYIMQNRERLTQKEGYNPLAVKRLLLAAAYIISAADYLGYAIDGERKAAYSIPTAYLDDLVRAVRAITRTDENI